MMRQFLQAHPAPLFTPANSAAIKHWLTAMNHFIATQLAPADMVSALRLRSNIVEHTLQQLFANYAFGASALFALGGFGRGELFLHSDVDLLVIYNPDSVLFSANELEQLKQFAALLWDIGLTSALSILRHDDSDCVNTLDTATSLAESRFLCGDTKLSTLPKEWLTRAWRIEAFTKAKVQEYRARHQRFGDNACHLEPNIKEGVGGLRDIHTLQWLYKFADNAPAKSTLAYFSPQWLTTSECTALTAAQTFFWQLREQLHSLHAKAYERLDFATQQQLAERLGFGTVSDTNTDAPTRLMRKYYEHATTVATLTAILIELFASEFVPSALTPLNDKFALCTTGNKRALMVLETALFCRQPTSIFEFFLAMGQHNIAHITPQTIRALLAVPLTPAMREHPEHQRLFIANLRMSNLLFERLRWLHCLGILSIYLPDFAHITGLAQYDLFHQYTVDAHTLLVLQLLQQLGTRTTDTLSDIYHNLPNKLPLTIAALLHDSAKGQGGDHSILGAVVVSQFCAKHALVPEDSALAAWLVKEHLTMSLTAQKKDIDDPEVISQFAQLVESKYRLDCLYLLTVADMNATNSQLWNNWRATLLKKLYHATLTKLNTGSVSPRQLIADKQALSGQYSQLAPSVLQQLWRPFPDAYFLKHDPKVIAWHADFLSAPTTTFPLIAIRAHADPTLRANELLVYSPNQAHLFVRLALLLDKLNYEIYQANIFTTDDNFALDSFIIVDKNLTSPASAPDNNQALIHALQSQLVSDSVTHLPSKKLTPSKQQPFTIATYVNFLAGTKTYDTCQLITKNRPSLLARVGIVFAKLNIDVHHATIITLGARAEDVFTISHQNQALSNTHKELLKCNLLAALDEH